MVFAKLRVEFAVQSYIKIDDYHFSSLTELSFEHINHPLFFLTQTQMSVRQGEITVQRIQFAPTSLAHSCANAKKDISAMESISVKVNNLTLKSKNFVKIYSIRFPFMSTPQLQKGNIHGDGGNSALNGTKDGLYEQNNSTEQ